MSRACFAGAAARERGPTRPALRYHGGKWRLAAWIVSHFPAHRTYVEPFGGGASVLLRKPRSYAEIYNDLDDEIAGFFRVLRDPSDAARLCRDLALTPFARAEFEAAYEPAEDPVERARRLVVLSFMGFGSSSCNSQARTGFRNNSNRSHTTPAHDWRSFPPHLSAIAERLRGVVIENRPAAEVIARFDAADSLHYLDPPYVHSTRSGRSGPKRVYRHEMSDDDHRDLARRIRGLRGFVVLSGYRSRLYDELFGDWRVFEKDALADGARRRVEALWLNPRAWAALEAHRAGGPLFDQVECR